MAELGAESRVMLVMPPRRVGKSIDEGILYTEVTATGEVEIRIWTVGSDEERTEMQRFEEAARRIDWSVPGPHEVRWEPVPRSNPRVACPEGPREDGPWNVVYDRIELQADDESVPLPTAEDLDAFQAESGFTLPASYRAFVLRFGPGRFDHDAEIKVASPGYPKDLTWHDLARLNRFYRFASRSDEDLTDWFPDVPLDRIRGLIVFGSDNGGDAYAFDARDSTDPARHECGVSLLPRHGALKRLAKTFDGFIGKHVIGRKTSMVYRPNRLSYSRDYDVAQTFLNDTGWPLGPDQDVGDFAHDLSSVIHCSPRGKLARAFKAWRKTHPDLKGGLL
ncbi:SMI1/KNR4 family protein [Aquisphaera insulae]|uniref:SMI1/KNR4 family protein n=1 Tax=Aquisphaera insulae TaxID=2712864 RepID=UPI0013E9B1B5|nr:SMI1/KNR4 family protein [Aquisphaera insulae]